ncbi:hypothetical protein CEXT_429551 [Caerostris extrusa]|uniref:Uncharacterized protein n=1 Tax=Caerostris extrusa TaxID=172846 RepID=A0AAV4MXF1_CAEEX|nr:hypothetical protein CEXT_429551 [Caerostris extrusa]
MVHARPAPESMFIRIVCSKGGGRLTRGSSNIVASAGLLIADFLWAYLVEERVVHLQWRLKVRGSPDLIRTETFWGGGVECMRAEIRSG